MNRWHSWFRKFSASAVAVGILTVLLVTAAPSVTYAFDNAFPNSPVYPCSPFSECHFYEEMDKLMKKPQNVIIMALVMAALNALNYATQQLATATAQFIIHGGKGGLSQYYPKTFGGFLQDVGTSALNSFVTDMNDYVKQSTGFNICAPIGLQALDIQLSIGLQQKLWPQKAINCSFQQFTQNFETSVQTLENADAFDYVHTSIRSDRSELGTAVTFQNQALVRKNLALDAQTLDRLEGKGIKPIADLITGNIRTPAEEVQNTLAETNRVKMQDDTSKLNISTIAANAFQIGVEQLPAVFGATLLNTLAVSGLNALKDVLSPKTGSDAIGSAQLLNPFAQGSAEQKSTRAVAFNDIVTPNLITTENQDFVQELSSCSTPRGLWGCAMDDAFASGLRSFDQNGAFTIAHAMGLDSGGNGFVFLHPEWELIPESDTKDNQDPGCYQRAYCASNLAKMRFARILPIGWELAANSPFNTKKGGKYVTLGEVVKGFSSCDDKNPVADQTHPWCHLIDPSWVLAAPQFKCQLKGFGDAVFPGQFPQRQQECSDVISCLTRDDKGKCIGGYGYCLSEKTVWRFDADVCQERYASCRTYTVRNKNQILGGTIPADAFGSNTVSYVRNTIDYGSCNANTVGCAYYATTLDTSTSTAGRWIGGISPWKAATATAAAIGPSISGPRVYFDAQAQSCDAGSDGCTRVLKVKEGTSALNLAQNGSFEATLASDATKADVWTPVSGAATITSDSFVGNNGLNFGSSAVVNQMVSIAPLRNYVVSFYGRIPSGTGTVQAVVKILKADGKTAVSTTGFYRNKSTCTISTATDAGVAAKGLSSDWQRFTCEFVSNSDAAFATLEVSGSGGAEIDAVQFEEAFSVTPFIEGVNSQLVTDHMKLAPEELACIGAKTDRKECSNYARVCQQADAGCQGYTDIGGSDTTEIPATLNANDICPAQCVGYAEYHKLPSAFDLVKNPTNALLDDPADDTSANFIPSSANACTAQDVGCELFTNVEAASAGGEQTAALSYIRACQKPNDDSTTYFTWEGSETSGYQLRTWSLVRDNTVTPAPPKILRKAGPEGFVKDPIACNETSWKAGIDPDCRQFYDEKGNVFYKYFSQTIVSTPECKNYRKDDSDIADCTKTGGTFNATTKECVYAIVASQSTSCQVKATACRAYIGTTGRNASTVLHLSFTGATTTAPFVSPSGVDVSISAEALTVGDKSLKIARAPSGPTELQTSVPFTSASGSLYTISFWAKTTDATRPSSVITVDGNVVGTFIPLTDWSRFEIGPFSPGSAPSSVIQFRNIPNVTFIDEVTLLRQQDLVYVKKNSWNIPAACDMTASGIPQPQAMLGCRAYKDRNGNVQNIRQFSRLCRAASIGCTGYVDTRNSDSAYAQSFTLKGYDSTKITKPWDSLYAGTVTVTRPADRFVYVIDEPSSHCQASADSCRAFGKPNFLPDGTLSTSTPFTTVFLKDDITKYMDSTGEPNMLCRPSELFCEQYGSQTPTGAVTSYFRDPGVHACEWRDKVVLPATASYPKGEYSGWFVQQSDPPVPCYPDKLSSGSSFLSEYSASLGYQGYTDTCPVDQAECTEFRDPNDHSDPVHPDGRAYYFINNQKIDQQACNGQVDLLSGCVLFRDMTNSQLTFSTVATYAKSKSENNSPEAPINCQTDPSNPYCVLPKHCQMSISVSGCISGETDCVSDRASAVSTFALKACSVDTDCSVKSKTYSLGGSWSINGTCVTPSEKNDANSVIKVKLDRDCSTWLGCSSGETVYDTAQGKYVDLCTNLAVCDQSYGSNGKQFCAHYVDRAAPKSLIDVATQKSDKLLNEGNFVSAATYSKRAIGFGKPDYSGYVLPNHYQIADFVTRRAGYEILQNQSEAVKNKFYSDYRIVARVPMCIPESSSELCHDGVDNNCNGLVDEGCPGVTTPQPTPSGAIPYKDIRYPNLNLCQDLRTKQIGYFVANSKGSPAESPAYCYLSIDVPYSQNTADLTGDGSTNPRNVQMLSSIFAQATNPELNPQLTKAFPPAECRANPDATAPFPNNYVQEWDTISDPPQPKTYVPGYENVPHCEYGENCSCTYRKVSYGSKTKYYEPYGPTPPSGICVGGSRDGQSCVPDQVIDSTSSTGSVTANNTCGSGTCQAIQSVNLIRGVFGQCLQRDASRNLAGSQDYTACLVWNPSPLLFGKNDAYHYQPTAGYVPPSNSGEYYCVAGAQPPRSVQPAAGWDWISSPGAMDDAKFHYDDAYTSDGDCFLCSGNEATFIDGSKAMGGAMGGWCESTDDDQDNGNHGADNMAGRWIMTGRGASHNYVEYFIGLKPTKWTNWLTGAGSTCNDADPSTCQDQNLLNAMLERNFSYFNFSPIVNPNGNGRLGCGYSPDWVQGTMPDDFDKIDSVKPMDQAWQQGFNSSFTHTLSSQTQNYLRNEDGSKLVKVPCYYKNDNPDDTGCYYKFWQLGYHDEGEEKFKMEWQSAGGPKKFGKDATHYEGSDATKPFFSIRAMFEDTSTDDNKKEIDDQPASGNRLVGPFRFVGWWVTASDPGSDSEQTVYMYMTIGHADICKEVAQVVSPGTRESTPFQDRIWVNSNYSIPSLGYVYSSLNAPFGSAMHTRPIGLDPLFETRGPLPGVKSSLRPPTFIAAGLEYTRGTSVPVANWAWLTNIFARVYRIYHYYDQPVSKESYACVTGPKFGTWCPDTSGLDSGTAAAVSQKYCGYNGTCTGPLPLKSGISLGLCNSLSGVNAGLSCSNDTSDPLSGYHVCHNAPVKQVNGNLVPQYKSCLLDPKWKNPTGSSKYYNCDPTDPKCAGVSKKEAAAAHAFRCAIGSVQRSEDTGPVFCSSPTNGPSVDCPAAVIGGTKPSSPSADNWLYSTCDSTKHCTNGFEHAICNTNADCSFSYAQWWGAYNAERPSTQSFDDFSGIKLDYGYGYYPGPFEHGGGARTLPWWSSFGWVGETISPGTGDAKYDQVIADLAAGKDPGCGDPTNKCFLDIGGQELGRGVGKGDVVGGSYVELTDMGRVNRFPGAFAAVVTKDDTPFFIPAHCERAPENGEYIKSFVEGTGCDKGLAECARIADRPYAPYTYYDAAKSSYTSSPIQRFYGDDKRPWKLATCEGGAYDGRTCTTEYDCKVQGTAADTLQAQSAEYCQPVVKGGDPNAGTLPKSGVKFSCFDPKGDAKSADLDSDENLCTHNAGYYPRADLCGNDPSRPECLTSVTQSDATSLDPRNPSALPPTDVTAGLYSPSYLAKKVQSDFGLKNPSLPTELSGAEYNYVSFYTPKPPVVAAPDTTRQCPASGSCPIAKLNSFTLESQTEGTISESGGQGVASIRFYGWVADNQAPLKDMWVDWGDGTVQEVHDARIKNKKPFCGGTNECQFVPGLTCNTDTDCPPAGGKCVPVGFCKVKPNVSCSTDDDCSTTAAVGGVKDKCVLRQSFGNSPEDCEANYFEFTHAYTCASGAQSTLKSCETQKYCSRNNAVTCSTDSDCGPADKCVAGLAPPKGCFDTKSVACRYTPRILLKDNWGWCTGECRVQTLGGKLAGGFKGSAGVNNTVLLSNGGCYDGSKSYLNTNTLTPYSVNNKDLRNMCDPATQSSTYSPWVVYQGAYQLGVTK